MPQLLTPQISNLKSYKEQKRSDQTGDRSQDLLRLISKFALQMLSSRDNHLHHPTIVGFHSFPFHFLYAFSFQLSEWWCGPVHLSEIKRGVNFELKATQTQSPHNDLIGYFYSLINLRNVKILIRHPKLPVLLQGRLKKNWYLYSIELLLAYYPELEGVTHTFDLMVGD